MLTVELLLLNWWLTTEISTFIGLVKDQHDDSMYWWMEAPVYWQWLICWFHNTHAYIMSIRVKTYEMYQLSNIGILLLNISQIKYQYVYIWIPLYYRCTHLGLRNQRVWSYSSGQLGSRLWQWQPTCTFWAEVGPQMQKNLAGSWLLRGGCISPKPLIWPQQIQPIWEAMKPAR